MNKLGITTSVKCDEWQIAKAQKLAREKGYNYIVRDKKTIKNLLEICSGVFVVYKDKLSFYNDSGELFFHPDTARLRIKNNDNEPLLELIGSDRKNILDCTLGLASDSTIMSYAGHNVVALEKNNIIYEVVSDGLENYCDNEKITQAMRDIKVINIDSYNYLKSRKDNSFDVIYFDPMFSENIKESTNLDVLTTVAAKDILTKEILQEAKRVAKEKIIIKAHFRDTVFEQFGFERIIRKNTKFHYGFIDLK